MSTRRGKIPSPIKRGIRRAVKRGMFGVAQSNGVASTKNAPKYQVRKMPYQATIVIRSAHASSHMDTILA